MSTFSLWFSSLPFLSMFLVKCTPPKSKKQVRPSGENNALRRTYWQTLADNYARTRDLHPHRHRDPHIYSDTHEIACSQLINTFPQWKNRPVGYKSCFEFVDHLTEGKKKRNRRRSSPIAVDENHGEDRFPRFFILCVVILWSLD